MLLKLILVLFLGTSGIKVHALLININPVDVAEPAVYEPGKLTGRVIENGSNVPLEFATVAVYSASDSSLVDGAITDPAGRFTVDDIGPGDYYVEVRFMGYEYFVQEDVRLNRENQNFDLGLIGLNPASENISELTIRSQGRAIAYDIDKKVIDPSFYPAASNGTAIDILANTPSVTVDIEGNVSLRGSSGFTVLIDGRPTPFDPVDALQQIPASSIRNIEIITNPSAKYDPDGNAGIININTKRSRFQGISGIANLSGDTNESLSGDLLLNYRYNKFNFYVSGNRSNRLGQGAAETRSMTIDTDTSYILSFGQGKRNSTSYSLKSGFDYYIDDFNTLTFNINFSSRARYEDSFLDFQERSSTGYVLNSFSNTFGSRSGEGLNLSLDYKKLFRKEGQELTGFLYYENSTSDEYTLFDQYDNDQYINGLRGWEVGPSEHDIRARLDYIQPLSGKMKIETGVQSRISRELEWNDVHWFSSSDDNYEPSPASPYYTDTDLSRDIHSLYGIFSNSTSTLGYQVGLRTEYTYRVLSYSANEEPYKINRFDYFPTLHFSYNLPREQQVIASYSRRIDRPRGYYLEPFITYENAYSVRQGNPSILPEYIDSYEFGYQRPIMEEGFLSAELYFRKTNNKIERVQNVYQPNVLLRTMANVGTDYSLGTELMLNLKPVEWWNINLMGNIYNYRLEGELEGMEINASSNNWNSRFNNTFFLGKNTRLQVDATYYSPTVNAQGRREGFLFTNMAARQDMLNNKLSATLSIRDVLGTAKFEFLSEGQNFSSYRKFEMKSPVVSLTLSYRINDFKPRRVEGQGGQGEMDIGGGGEI